MLVSELSHLICLTCFRAVSRIRAQMLCFAPVEIVKKVKVKAEKLRYILIQSGYLAFCVSLEMN